MSYNIEKNAALIIVDPQVDFFEGGALPVPASNAIIPVIQNYIEKCCAKRILIFVTRDWHPKNHSSFKEQGGSWPAHCIHDTPGAQFHAQLAIPSDAIIISKAQHQNEDAYSGFHKTTLRSDLLGRGIRRICVCGLATDYCVKQTVLDALNLRLEVLLLTDAIKGVNVNPWDSRNAICDMVDAGAQKAMIGDFR